MSRLPDESPILRFRHLLEEHGLGLQIMAAINAALAAWGLLLKTGTVDDATLIAAPRSTKNQDGQRGPEMHQSKKGNQWHFGMKAHIGVDIPIRARCTPSLARLLTSTMSRGVMICRIKRCLGASYADHRCTIIFQTISLV
jgi:IS5 family transposase